MIYVEKTVVNGTDVWGFVPSAIRKSLFQSSSRLDNKSEGKIKRNEIAWSVIV
jgi:hypothetical protein